GLLQLSTGLENRHFGERNLASLFVHQGGVVEISGSRRAGEGSAAHGSLSVNPTLHGGLTFGFGVISPGTAILVVGYDDFMTMDEKSLLTVGVLVNPFAGIGGAVGLKGSDGAETRAETLRRGARPMAVGRMSPALHAV